MLGSGPGHGALGGNKARLLRRRPSLRASGAFTDSEFQATRAQPSGAGASRGVSRGWPCSRQIATNRVSGLCVPTRAQLVNGQPGHSDPVYLMTMVTASFLLLMDFPLIVPFAPL
jgi:hypothetical protein